MFETNNLIYAAVVLFAIYLIHLAFFKYSAKTEKFVDYNTDVANYTQKHLDKTIEQLEEYITEYGIPDNEDNEDEEDILVKELMDAIEDRYIDKVAPFEIDNMDARESWAIFKCENLDICE